MAYRDWKAAAWFVLRCETAPGQWTACEVCKKPLEAGDLAYIEDGGYEGPGFAHTACADSMTECGCCEGRGWHALERAPRPLPRAGLGVPPRTRECAACGGRGFNPGVPRCPSPGLPPV
jgi:hypothetical protein